MSKPGHSILAIALSHAIMADQVRLRMAEQDAQAAQDEPAAAARPADHYNLLLDGGGP